MFQTEMRRTYWRVFVLIALVAGLIIFARFPSARADGCAACDENYYYCVSGCNSSDPNYQSCVNACQASDSSCTNFCTEGMDGYHSYEYTYQQELQICLQMGHRAAYRRCYNGNPIYPDDYNTCIQGGDTVDDCCLQQESTYDWENCY